MTMEALLTLLSETLSEKDKSLLDLLRLPSDAPEIVEQMAGYDDTIIGQPSWWEDARNVLSEAAAAGRGVPFVVGL